MNIGKNTISERTKEKEHKQYTGNKSKTTACLYLIFGDSGLFLAVPLAVMKARAIAVKYV